MTEQPDRSDARVDRWLTSRHEELVADLADVLDLDTGVGEATLPGRGRDLTADLGSLLDLDTGLAAVLTPGTASSAPPASQNRAPSRDLAEAVAAAPPAVRLQQRARVLLLDVVLDLAKTVMDARRLADRLIDTTAGSYQNRIVKLIVYAGYRVRVIEGMVAGDSAVLPRGLSPAHIDNLVECLEIARSIARASRDRIDPGGSIKPGRLVRRSFADLPPALRVLSGYVTLLTDLVAREIGAAVGYAGEPTRTGERRDLLHAVNDLTGADLTLVDLASIPLGGVRWSDSTRWPSEWADHIARASVPVGDGVYEYRPGPQRPTTVRPETHSS